MFDFSQPLPPGLVKDGLYKKIAISVFPGAQDRQASLAIVAKAGLGFEDVTSKGLNELSNAGSSGGSRTLVVDLSSKASALVESSFMGRGRSLVKVMGRMSTGGGSLSKSAPAAASQNEGGTDTAGGEEIEVLARRLHV